TITLKPMQAVVQPLGDLEELGAGRENHPARLHASATAVSKQRPQHLNAAPLRRGVHIPKHPTAKLPSGVTDQVNQRLVLPPRDHGREALRVHRLDRHVLKARHLSSPTKPVRVDHPTSDNVTRQTKVAAARGGGGPPAPPRIRRRGSPPPRGGSKDRLGPCS